MSTRSASPDLPAGVTYDLPDWVGQPPRSEGDSDWLDAHKELVNLHLDKSSRYGQAADRLDNFVVVSEVTASAPERYPAERIIEKAVRALNMIAHGEACNVEEWMDIASLALCAEALRRRRDYLARPGSPGRA